MTRAVVLAAGILLASAAAAVSDPAGDLARQVHQLVAKLDAGQVAARDEAEAALSRLGPAALAHLPRITARTSPELKQRLVRVRAALELQYAQAAGRPSKVTLVAENLKLSAVLAAIEKQTGNKIVDRRAAEDRTDPVVKVKFNETPFWQALDDVLDQAKLSIDAHAADDDGNPLASVAIVSRRGSQPDRRATVSYAGPLRIEPTSVQSRRDLRSADAGQLKVLLSVSWEPQISPVAVNQPAQAVKAVDDRGNTVAASNAEADPEIPVASAAKSLELEVPLALPAREAKKIASLKGKLVLVTPGRNETFRFEKLSATKKAKDSTEKSRGDVTVTLARVAENNDLWEIRVQVNYGRTEGAVQSHYGWIYENRAYLEGPDGKPITPAGFESDGIEGGIEATYYFNRKEGLEGCTFVYSTPAVLLNVPVEYELKDLPLP